MSLSSSSSSSSSSLSLSLSRLWRKLRLYSRDGYRFTRAAGREIRPLLLPKSIDNKTATNNKTSSLPTTTTTTTTTSLPTTATISDTLRNVIVTQARDQSNMVAISLLSLQQQYNLIQYHGGLYNYYKQKYYYNTDTNNNNNNNNEEGVQTSGATSDDSNCNGNPSTATATATATATSTNNHNTSNNRARIAFMITSNMRKELTSNPKLNYTQEDIKTMTPVQASLILHHAVHASEANQRLPVLEREYREQIEKEAEEARANANARAAEQERAQQREAVNTAKAKEEELQQQERSGELSSQQEPNEGVSTGTAITPATSKHDESNGNNSTEYQLDNPSPPPPPPPPRNNKNNNNEDNSLNVDNEPVVTEETDYNTIAGRDDDKPLGSFVATMEEQTGLKREWYEVVEIRSDDNDDAEDDNDDNDINDNNNSNKVPVGLFTNEEEAVMAMNLKTKFAQRRAEEDIYNKNNVPVTTYQIEKTIK